MRSFVPLAFASILLLPACRTAPSSSFEGPVGRLIVAGAAESRVSADLMAAIAHVEGGLQLAPLRDVAPDETVPVAGVLELRHGRYDSLARGAALMGRSELDLQRDLALGTAAGARVLADLATGADLDRDDLAAWAPIVEELSGHLARGDRERYRARVFSVLRDGGALPGRDGEVVVVAPHPEIPVALTFAPPGYGTADTPEYAPATWFTTPSANKWTAGRGGNPVTMIAIHDTEGGWDASVATLQNDTGKSVHYIVDADGSRVGQFVHESDTAWHVGNWFYNQHMVGIEHVGFASGYYQTAQYQASAALVRDIAARQHLGPAKDGTGLDRSILVGHQEVPNGNAIAEDSPPCPDAPSSCVKDNDYGGANNHRDPGIHWDWCQYLEIIGQGAHCKCNDAYTHFNCTHDLTERVKCSDGVHVVIDHCANESCMVEPVGQDDVCGQEASSSTSSSSGSSSTGGAGMGGAGGAGAGGSASMGGSHGTGAPASGGGHASNQSSSCAMGAGNAGDGGAALAAGLLALAAIRRRRTVS